MRLAVPLVLVALAIGYWLYRSPNSSDSPPTVSDASKVEIEADLSTNEPSVLEPLQGVSAQSAPPEEPAIVVAESVPFDAWVESVPRYEQRVLTSDELSLHEITELDHAEGFGVDGLAYIREFGRLPEPGKRLALDLLDNQKSLTWITARYREREVVEGRILEFESLEEARRVKASLSGFMLSRAEGGGYFLFDEKPLRESLTIQALREEARDLRSALRKYSDSITVFTNSN